MQSLSNLATDTNTSILQAPPRNSRKLNMVKCENCRSSKKGCVFLNGPWPEKCVRCLERQLDCPEPCRIERQFQSDFAGIGTAGPGAENENTTNPREYDIGTARDNTNHEIHMNHVDNETDSLEGNKYVEYLINLNKFRRIFILTSERAERNDTIDRNHCIRLFQGTLCFNGNHGYRENVISEPIETMRTDMKLLFDSLSERPNLIMFFQIMLYMTAPLFPSKGPFTAQRPWCCSRSREERIVQMFSSILYGREMSFILSESFLTKSVYQEFHSLWDMTKIPKNSHWKMTASEIPENFWEVHGGPTRNIIVALLRDLEYKGLVNYELDMLNFCLSGYQKYLESVAHGTASNLGTSGKCKCGLAGQRNANEFRFLWDEMTRDICLIPNKRLVFSIKDLKGSGKGLNWDTIGDAYIHKGYHTDSVQTLAELGWRLARSDRH
ncbi:hypothetical protein EDC01DRAFT_644234 [Geopyxis carbonaria]|nr:hypothetical protein EDC01DRAFT_644234 [Geopyxis carbonaria]